MLYPWNTICKYLLRHGKIEVTVSGLEDVSLEDVLRSRASNMIREIQLMVENPDMTDSEKVEYIRDVLEEK